jgi:hypothetical protein
MLMPATMHLESAARPTVSINGTIESSRVFERAAFGNRHSKIGEETGSFQLLQKLHHKETARR